MTKILRRGSHLYRPATRQVKAAAEGYGSLIQDAKMAFWKHVAKAVQSWDDMRQDKIKIWIAHQGVLNVLRRDASLGMLAWLAETDKPGALTMNVDAWSKQQGIRHWKFHYSLNGENLTYQSADKNLGKAWDALRTSSQG